MSSSKLPLPRKSTVQSSIPVLRRSNSQSSIPLRQSRSSVRGPSQSQTFRLRAKSLTTKSPLIATNLLHANYGLNRGRCTSSGRTNTPQQDRRDWSPYSIESRVNSARPSSAVKDTRPINDKDWQRLQLAKVKACLLELDSAPPVIKPLSVATFVYVMNLLLKEFDNRSSITTENYKEEVVKYLKIYSYPGGIKPSLIKNISAPHEFPKILAILSWLVNIIEVLRNPDRILYPRTVDRAIIELYQLVLSYNTKKYLLWNEGAESGADNEFIQNLRAYYNIDNTVLEQQEVQFEKLKADHDSLVDRQTNLNFKEKIKELTEDSRRTKDLNDEYIQQHEEFLKHADLEKAKKLKELEEIKKQIAEKEGAKQSLQSTLSTQKYDHLVYKSLNKEIQSLNHTINLHDERMNGQKDLFTDYDVRISAAKKKLETTSHRINNRISELSLVRPKLNKLKIRETGFLRPNFIDELNKTSQKLNVCEKQLQVELKEVEKEYARVVVVNEEKKYKIDEATSELKESTKAIEKVKKHLKELIVSHKTEIKKQESHLDDLQKKLLHVKLENEKLSEERKDKLRDSEKILAEKTAKLQRHCALAKVFFEKIASSIFQICESQAAQRKAITSAMFEASKGDGVLEALAAGLDLELPPREDENKTDE